MKTKNFYKNKTNIFDIKKDLKWTKDVKIFINKFYIIILQEDQFLLESKKNPNLQNWRAVSKAFFERFDKSKKNKKVIRDR